MKKLSKILLVSSIVLSVGWVIVLALGLFNVLNYSAVIGTHFNYIAGFTIVILGLLLYIAMMFIEKWKNLIIPIWFKNLFYVAFFVFTNIYYFFGLYNTLAGLLIFDVYLAILINILSVSIFYNTQKDSKNLVKTSDKFLTVSCCSYSFAAILIYQVLSCVCKIIANNDTPFGSIAAFVAESSIMILVSLIFAIMFTLSLKRNRVLINKCLIKHIPADKSGK